MTRNLSCEGSTAKSSLGSSPSSFFSWCVHRSSCCLPTLVHWNSFEPSCVVSQWGSFWCKYITSSHSSHLPLPWVCSRATGVGLSGHVFCLPPGRINQPVSLGLFPAAVVLLFPRELSTGSPRVPKSPGLSPASLCPCSCISLFVRKINFATLW